MKIRKIRPDEVVFTVEAAHGNLILLGNALASGDDEQDKAAEDEIIRRLNDGDVWAWAAVLVTATLTLPNGKTIAGHASLGGCSYADEKDFCQPGGYFDDMKAEALDDLQQTLEVMVEHGAQLGELYAEES